MIEQRFFSANVGDNSTGQAGPDAIETDIDNLLANDQELLGITGDKTTLTTTNKTNLVSAINEHETQINSLVDLPKIRLIFLAQLSAPDNLEFIIPFNSTIDANKINHDDVVDNTKAIITEDGEYLIIGQLNLASNNTGYRRLNIRKNGVIQCNANMNGVTGDFTRIQVSTIMKLVAGDYIELSLQQNRGSALDVYVGTAVRPPLTIIKVG